MTSGLLLFKSLAWVISSSSYLILKTVSLFASSNSCIVSSQFCNLIYDSSALFAFVSSTSSVTWVSNSAISLSNCFSISLCVSNSSSRLLILDSMVAISSWLTSRVSTSFKLAISASSSFPFFSFSSFCFVNFSFRIFASFYCFASASISSKSMFWYEPLLAIFLGSMEPILPMLLSRAAIFWSNCWFCSSSLALSRSWRSSHSSMILFFSVYFPTIVGIFTATIASKSSSIFFAFSFPDLTISAIFLLFSWSRSFCA